MIKSLVGYLQFLVRQNFYRRTECPVCFSFRRTVFDFGWTLPDVRPLFQGLDVSPLNNEDRFIRAR